MSCLYKIKEAYPTFTETERRIADYIQKNHSKVLEMSSQKLGECTETSAAALIRFAQKLGYKGITAMKVDLAKDDTDESDELFNVLINENDSLDVVVKKVQIIAEKNIHETYKLLNMNQLKKAIRMIRKAKTIYLIGVGGSGIICMDFMHKLTRINRNVIYHEDVDFLLSRIAHIDSADILIAISYSGKTRTVNLAADYAKSRGACVLAITQYNVKSPLSKKSDIALYTPIEEKELRLGAISSRNAAFVLTDLIYYGIAKENLPETQENLKKTLELTHLINQKK